MNLWDIMSRTLFCRRSTCYIHRAYSSKIPEWIQQKKVTKFLNLSRQFLAIFKLCHISLSSLRKLSFFNEVLLLLVKGFCHNIAFLPLPRLATAVAVAAAKLRRRMCFPPPNLWKRVVRPLIPVEATMMTWFPDQIHVAAQLTLPHLRKKRHLWP